MGRLIPRVASVYDSRRPSPIHALAALLCFPALYLAVTPIIYIVMWAISGTGTPGLLGAPSAHWLVYVLNDGDWLSSLVISTCFAIASSSIALIVIIISNYYFRMETRARDYGTTLVVLLPLLFPQVIFGLAWSLVIARTGLATAVGVVVAHIVTMMPVQYLIVKSEAGILRQSQLWAGAVMGAAPFANIIRVYVPLMRKPLVTAWAIGALISFDELVVTLFLWSEPREPVALRLWNLFGRYSDPAPAVVALTILCVVAVLATAIAFALRRVYGIRA